jgi:predicted porin
MESFLMKKSLIALAVLTFAGAASAQTVSLYGRIDASIGSEKTLAAGSVTKMFTDNLTTSRWGMRGSEDLGGGLKANFVLETAFASDTGVGNAGFSRQSWVGLSGGFGALKLGKTDSVYKDIFDSGVAHNLFDSEFTPTKIAYTGVGNFTSRPDNQVRYESPNMSGFSAGLTYALDEDSATEPQITAFNVRYKAGAMDIGFATQKQDYNPIATLDRTYNVLSASYNLGMVKVSGQFQNAKESGGRKDTEYAIGLAVPMGAVELSAGLANGKTKTAAGTTSAKGNAYAFGATYTMSKRTRLYGGYLTGDVKNAAGVKTADRSLFALGVRHDF